MKTDLNKVEWNKEFKSYNGLKYSADSADCSIPMTFDSHSNCSFNCLFCFTKNLCRNEDRNPAKKELYKRIGQRQTQWDIKLFYKFMRRELRNEWTKSMYPLMDEGQIIQFGSLGDPFDKMEEEFEWSYRALPFLERMKQPTRISTKGGDLLCTKKYLDLFEGLKYMWVNFSMVTPDDDAGSKIEHLCPLPSKRFQAMKELSDRGIPVCLRYRPIIPELAKRKHSGEPEWKIMIDKAVESGAKGISYEVIFLDKGADKAQTNAYKRIGDVSGNPNFIEDFTRRSIPAQACRRTTRFYKYGLMMNIHDYAKSKGLIIGVSDPHFKESCLPRETDVLTPEGWKRIDHLKVDEFLYSYNEHSDRIELDQISKTHKFEVNEETEFIELHGEGDSYKLLMTGRHRVYHQRRKKICVDKSIYRNRKWKGANFELDITLAKDLPEKDRIMLLVSAEKETLSAKDNIHRINDIYINDNIIKLIGWIITEGSNRKGADIIKITQSIKANERYVNEIHDLLEIEKIKYSEKLKECGGMVRFNILSEYGKRILCVFDNNCIHRIPKIILKYASVEQLKILYETMIKGDGYFNTSNNDHYFSKDEGLADDFQHLCILIGYRARKRKNKGGWGIYCSENKKFQISYKRKGSYNGSHVYCLSTSNKTFIARQNGEVFISGNSDYPCCCAISDKDPIFGKYSKKCMTTIVIEGRKAYEKNGDHLQFHFSDWVPDWAYKVRFSMMCALGSAEAHKKYRNVTWADNLRNKWNDPNHFRSPYYYFESILHPVDIDDEDNVVYEYRDWYNEILDDKGRELAEKYRYDTVPLSLKKEIKKL